MQAIIYEKKRKGIKKAVIKESLGKKKKDLFKKEIGRVLKL